MPRAASWATLRALRARTAHLVYKNKAKMLAVGSVAVIVVGSCTGAALKGDRQASQAKSRYEGASIDDRLDMLRTQRQRLASYHKELEAKLARLEKRAELSRQRGHDTTGKPA